jgi:hypothetical protein
MQETHHTKTAIEPVKVPRWLAALFVVMALVSVGSLAWVSTEAQRCTETIAENIVGRAKLTQQGDAAVHRLIVTIYNNPSNDQVEIEAFENYLQTYERNKANYKTLPLDPDQICD